jgi:hypothetical protein
LLRGVVVWDEHHMARQAGRQACEHVLVSLAAISPISQRDAVVCVGQPRGLLRCHPFKAMRGAWCLLVVRDSNELCYTRACKAKHAQPLM